MILNKYKLLIGVGLLAGVSLFSCNDDLEPYSNRYTDGQPDRTLRVYVTFEEFKTPDTRLSIRTDDGWTYTTAGFTTGDTVGVFTRTGNLNIPGGGPMINIPMHFVVQDYATSNGGTDKATTLENDTVESDPASMYAAEVLMYYPYTSKMGDLTKYIPQYRTMDTVGVEGLELRVFDKGMYKCRDIAYMYSATADYLKKGILSGAFYHGNAELILKRGKGFENPPADKRDSVFIVLNRGFSHVRIVSYVHNGNTQWTNQCYYKEGYAIDGKAMSELECRRWQAWPGGRYIYSSSKDTIQEGESYWCVLPTNYASRINSSTTSYYATQMNTRPFIDYIEMYDNDGRKQRITSIPLLTSPTATPSKYPYNGYREGLIIEMDELGPTVSPVMIKNWDEEGDDKNITDYRNLGISSAEDYNDWVVAYQNYLATGDETDLYQYGDKEDGVWYFYITETLDFDSTSGLNPYQVEVFKDRLVGANNLFNVEMRNVNITYPLFGRITGNGGIENIDFNRIYVNYAPTGDAPAIGCIAREIDDTGATSGLTITGGSIINCNIINGTVRSNGPVGILAGSMTNGRIADCNFYGFIMGSATADDEWAKLLGETPQSTPSTQNVVYTNITSSIGQ